MATIKRKKSRLLKGKVVSDKMDKTIIVEIQRISKDPRFLKYLKTKSRYKVHDAKSEAKLNDYVEFYEEKPVSKTKFMYLNRIIKSAQDTTIAMGNKK